ncbi:hypothetical protein [Microbacterium murale]|uniref:Uncharacterized protein n=1 Tax=Microbacterium murale TaxID=1081040 RepID=A0ABQ1R970_9MICO|nr:hypothetical protein [Microbacterium murale]GGD62779.1 hypothetical protein GCM10007269_02430 [Microbacterium murale]
MTSAPKASTIAVVLLLLGGALSGCAPEASETKPTPMAGETSTAASPSPTPGPVSPTASPEQPETPPAFTESELVQICIDATTSAYDPGVVFDAQGARIEKRTVPPEWLVLVPAQTNGYDGESVCTIGGSPADPDIEMASGSIQPLPEEQIQRLIRGENEGGE